MDDQSLRQRGWSIHSADDNGSRQRPRADTYDTVNTEPSMSEAEKLHLLDSAFDGVDGGEEAAAAVPRSANVAKGTTNTAEEGEDNQEMFGEGGERNDNNDDSEDGEEGADEGENSEKLGGEPPNKRRKTGADGSIAVDNASEVDSSGEDSSDAESEGSDDPKSSKRPHIKLSQKQQEELNFAKTKLSKWAARLFDPNRPRGLVEAPAVIPLNDEFLTAFGKREREYDEIAGREIDIDKTSLDIVDVSDGDDDEEGGERKNKGDKDVNYADVKKGKVKISNLSYNTTAATIARTCGVIGGVVDVNLMLDDNGKSTGRAYVVFEEHEMAIACAEKMHEKQLEGRTLYITLALKSKGSAPGRKSMDAPKKVESRYWERDISTKCHCCGEVGHIARNCPNEQKLKPCGLCAEVGHDSWSCPQKSICFNCGIPGHVVRDCKHRRGLPQRCVCTICYRSGHHRYECRERPWNAHHAVCMQCGQKGHTMCTEMRWFFGLKGVSCFNCGEKGHRGIQCQRPDVNTCHQNPDITQNEIEKAGAISLSDQVSDQRSSRESRDSRGRQQSRSLPPPRSRGNHDGYSRQGSNSHDPRRQEPNSQRSHRRY